MSCYEWSHGKIVLPSGQFATFRKAFEEAERNKVESVFEMTQEFWKRLSPKERREQPAYRDAVSGFEWTGPPEFLHEARFVLIQHAARAVDSDASDMRPCRVLKGDLQWPNNRTRVFQNADLFITFDPGARTVEYTVHENNHAREWADNSMLGTLWNQQIARVRWTRNSGGVILGNDEYHREAALDSAGAGGSYVVAAYGYLGAKEAPGSVQPFINAEGQSIKVVTRVIRGGRLVSEFVPDHGRTFAGRW